jgi:protein-tyrosine phosphatase
MTSIVRLIRDALRHIPKDVPLDYSPITENLFIGAWPTKYHVETIKSLGVSLVISTILETPDKELGQEPLSLVRVRATDLGPRLIFPTGQLMKGVEAAVPMLHAGEGVMVFCKAGKHRSAAMTSCILVAMGHAAEEAMRTVEQARPTADLKPSIRQRIMSFEKVWQERHPVA